MSQIDINKVKVGRDFSILLVGMSVALLLLSAKKIDNTIMFADSAVFISIPALILSGVLLGIYVAHRELRQQ